MLELARGNLLDAEVDALVNTVNCVGVMGKGIALQFKQAFPENTKVYERACKGNELHPGKMLVVATGRLSPKFVINFPTKTHWKGKSRITFIKAGLESLLQEVASRGITSIAVPPLGCGNGGLDWREVYPLIRDAFAAHPEVRALIYAPENAPQPESMPVATKRPSLTRARALLVKLIEQYCRPGYRLSLLEIQKLAYFLQEANEPLRLNFVKDKFGPYAENLNFVLQRMEGHLIRGYGDRSGRAQLELVPGASEQANEFLRPDSNAAERLRIVSEIIEGFETPYGLELLATVHWVAKHEAPLATDEDWAIAKVHAWNARKQKIFSAQHIRTAWRRLKDKRAVR
jgi:O-acetyl-ADP-ribose deacetylase (regulator of RNase III)